MQLKDPRSNLGSLLFLSLLFFFFCNLFGIELIFPDFSDNTLPLSPEFSPCSFLYTLYFSPYRIYNPSQDKDLSFVFYFLFDLLVIIFVILTTSFLIFSPSFFTDFFFILFPISFLILQNPISVLSSVFGLILSQPLFFFKLFLR